MAPQFKKVVLKLDKHDQKAKQKALKLVCSIPGIESIALDMKDNKLTVTGDVDPVTLVVKLRRRAFKAEIISVGPANELEKDKHKKEESKKADEKKKMDSGQVMRSRLDYPNIPLWQIPCSMSTSSLDIDADEELEVTSFPSAEPLPQEEFEISIHNSETQVFQSVSVLPSDNIGIPSNQIPQHGMSPILETKTEIIASETERKLQMKPELSVGPTMSITLIKSRWAQFSNMQLVTFHSVHSTKMHDAIKDPGFGNFQLGENNYMVFVRINEKIEKSLKPESDQAKFSGGESLSSGLLGRRGTFISLLEDFILWEAGVGLTEPPLKEKWGRPFVIALMNNEFSSLSTKPNCPKLGLLFLQNNRCLRTISDSFFDDMPSLGVLDLSNTGIRSLPSSLFKLTELQALFLRDCNNLDGLPPEVGNLEHIEVLDLWSTEVYSLPDEIAKLKYLKCLRVSFYGADDDSEYHNLPPDLISSGVISSLLALQALSIIVHPADWRWKNNAKAITIDVSSLGKLTYLQFYFPEVELFHLFIHESLSWKAGCLRNFKFVVGNDINRIVSRVPDDIEYYYNEYDRCLRFVNDDRIPKDVGVLKRIMAFYLDNHCAIKNLLEFGVASLKELKFCVVRECTNIVAIIEGEEITESVLPCLVHLSLHYLWRLETIWKGPVPHGSLQGLKYLSLHTCPRLEFVLSWSMLHCLSNMEELMVEDCASVKVIIEMEGQTVDHGAIFPCLKKVTLSYLPQLQFLSNGVCPLSAHVSVYACPKWKEKQEDMPCQEVGG